MNDIARSSLQNQIKAVNERIARLLDDRAELEQQIQELAEEDRKGAVSESQ